MPAATSDHSIYYPPQPLPTPTPSPRDLRVKVEAVSINPVDTKVRMRAAPPEGEVKVLGWDAAGIVEAVGAQVTLFKPGDAVFYAGSIARPGTNAELHLVDERIVGGLSDIHRTDEVEQAAL